MLHVLFSRVRTLSYSHLSCLARPKVGAEYMYLIIEQIQQGKVFSADFTFLPYTPKGVILAPFLLQLQEAREICETGLIMLLTLLGIRQLLP